MPYVTKSQLNRLRKIAQAGTLKHACFSFPEETVTCVRSMGGANDGVFQTDAFIKGRVAIYNQSYIVAPLEEIISELQEKTELTNRVMHA